MNIVQQLKREEGCVLHAYEDSEGWLTIGVGRLVDKRKGGGISNDEAEYLLRNDVARFTHEVVSALPWVSRLSEPRQAVLIGMAFQMGTAGLLSFKQTLGAVRDEKYDHAAALMLQSKWAQQTPARAKRMSVQMATGDWAL